MEFRLIQFRERKRQGGEIVDHNESLESELGLERSDRKRPAGIGHLDQIASDGRRDTKCTIPRRGQSMGGEITMNRRPQRFKSRSEITFDEGRRSARVRLPGKSGVCAADIAE